MECFSLPHINNFMSIDKPIGEIIEAGTTAFVAQCLEVPREIVSRLYDPPPFGAFVKIGRPPPAPSPAQAAPLMDLADDEEDEDDLPGDGRFLQRKGQRVDGKHWIQ